MECFWRNVRIITENPCQRANARQGEIPAPSRKGCWMAYSSTTVINDEIYALPGPSGLRKFYFPRQRLTLAEASRILGISYIQLYRLDRSGTAPIHVRDDGNGTLRYVLLEDLISYLFPGSGLSTPVLPETPHKKRGRPRKPAQLGGRK